MTNSDRTLKTLRATARQLRESWSRDSGTSIHLVAADNLDEAADTILSLKSEIEALREALANIAEGDVPRAPDRLRIPGSEDCDHGRHLHDQRCYECVRAYARATLSGSPEG